MKKIFTLVASILLVGSGSLMAKDIVVTPDQDLGEVVAAAEEGDVLILSDGTYSGNKTINITKSITIKAENLQGALLYQYQFAIPDATTVANVLIDGILAEYDDAGNNGKYFFQVNMGTSVLNNLTIKNSRISRYGRGVIRGTTAGAKLNNLLIENCILEENSNDSSNAGYANINPQKLDMGQITIKNTTVYNSRAALLRYEGTTNVTVNIENSTILRCGSAAGRKMIEIAGTATNNIKLKDCIFSGSYDSTTPENKAIDLKSMGSIENCLLEGYSNPLTANVISQTVVEATVASFDYVKKEITTNPSTISGIGDPRWALNGGQVGVAPQKEADKNIVNITYLNLLGERVSHPQGIVIKKVTFEDNSVAFEKTIVK